MSLSLPASRICFVLLSGIGEAVHGLPVVNALKDDDPSRRITWVAEHPVSELVAPHPSVDRVVVFEKERGPAGVIKLWRDLRPLEFDLTLNTRRYFKSLWPTLFSGAPHRLGLDRGRARDGVWLASNHRLPRRGWRHTQDVMLEFLRYLGLDVAAAEVGWRLSPTGEERQHQRAFFADLERPVIGLVLASGNPRKDWLPERYAPLADRLSDRFGGTLVLVGGPTGRERSAAEALKARAAAGPVDALGDDARRLVWLVEGCDLLVSPDSGPLHVAHALGVPVVGLYGHTNPWRVGPYERFHDLVIDRYTEPGEEPDPSRYAPRHGRMETITPDDVMEKVELAFRRYAADGDAAARGEEGRA